MKKKLLTIVAVILAAAALVVGSVAGTVAFLTASSTVSNTFTVGNVAIEMFESQVNEQGVPNGANKLTDAEGKVIGVDLTKKKTSDGNSYHLLPDSKYTKDPTIYISDATNDAMFLFVKTSNQIRTIEKGNVADATEAEKLTTMRAQMKAKGWAEYMHSDNNIDIIWVYVGDNTGITPKAVTNQDTNCERQGQFDLFGSFEVDDNADIQKYAGATVTVTAYAIQSSGMETVAEAWGAIMNEYPYESGILNPATPGTTAD